MSLNILEPVIKNADRTPDKIAIRHKKDSISYSTLINAVKVYAAHLQARGIKKGDRVLVFVPMSIELYKVVLALFYLGAIAVFADAWAGKKRLEHCLQVTTCRGFIGTHKALLLSSLSYAVRKIPIKITTGKLKRVKNKSVSIKLEVVQEEDGALITFTTGSTGNPAAAYRTHGFLQQQHKALCTELQTTPADVSMVTLPIFLLHNLATGSTSIIPDFNPARPHRINTEKIIQEINDLKPSVAVASPIFYEILADNCLKNNITLQYPAKLYLGGAPVFPVLAEKLNAVFVQSEVNIVYGSTEAEPIATLKGKKLLQAPLESKLNGLLAGKPVDFIEVKIIQPGLKGASITSETILKDITLPVGQPGEICVAGPHVLDQYYNSQEAQQTNKIFTETKIWHKTGDAGYFDREGNLYLLGRVKHSIEFEKKCIYLFPVENTLKNLENVISGTLISLKGRLILVLQLEKDSKENRQKIQQVISALNIPYHEVQFIKQMPGDLRHHSKIDYNALLMNVSR
jgi:acyl-CoA synthetase (AMP-forming)/AMP-acid ligase II